MTGLSDASLWKRIESWQFDKPDVSLPFSGRLARETGWEPDFATAVIDEYRRFIYLACISDGIVTPSQEVDEVWHLHLTYTRDYWQDFCRDTLGREIHHTPTDGGPAEAEKFLHAYARTFELYEREFGEEPPADIWPDAATRFGLPQPARAPSGPDMPQVLQLGGGVLMVLLLCATLAITGAPVAGIVFLGVAGLALLTVFAIVTMPREPARRTSGKKRKEGAGCSGGGAGAGCSGASTDSGCGGGGGCGGGS